MSASSKKKLRNAQEAEKKTEKQLAEQREAKKLKTYTTVFVIVLVLMVCFALYTAITRTITRSGLRERNTVALTVGEHEISNAELNYYFIDTVNQFYSNYGSYAYLFGLDTTLPLNEQVLDEEAGTTWADDFLESAKESVQAVYALNDAAAEAGYALTDAEQETIDQQLDTIDIYATLYGYSEGEDYLKALYGNGATTKGYRAYIEMMTLAQNYQNYYYEELSYTDEEMAAEDAANPANYSSYSFNSYYLSTSRFLEGGTTADDGTTTYSDEEQAAAREAAEEAANSLTDGITTVEELDAAIQALPVNAENASAASTTYDDYFYTSINSIFADWLTEDARTAGDIEVFVNASTADDGTETVNGYYVVLFRDSTDNKIPLVNVRHILVSFEGGTYDSTTATTTYSDEEKAAAMTAAQEILNTWTAGEATEDSFAALANEKSADSDGTDGGLYENVYPGQMVTNFNDWCFDETRKAGNTGIVETEYGCHVMYFSGHSDTTYRDMLIEDTLATEDANNWYSALIEAAVVTEQNMKYIPMDLVLSAS